MNSLQVVRRLIWLYFYLWVFEGALRFWVLPGLSDLLLVVRDPVVLLIYMAAIQARVLPRNGFLAGSLMLAFACFLAAMTVGHGNVVVALYGVRATFLHLPLIFVMQRVLRKRDVERFGEVLLWLAVPMAILAVQQFRSPAESWINKGGMRAHYSTVRPAGTFSFVSGMVAYAALLTAFLAHSFSSQRHFGLVRSTAAAGAALAMVAVSNSRTMTFSVASVFIMMVGLVAFRGTKIIGVVMLVGVLGLAAATLSSTEFFAEGTASLQRRFKDAAVGESIMETAADRILGSFTDGISSTASADWFGLGIGAGTNAGAQMLVGQRVFLAGETEWTRVIMELGPIFGWLFLTIRMLIVWRMLKTGIKSLSSGNLLPMLLFGAGAMPVLMGQWGIPTNQGFASLIAGLCLAGRHLDVSRRKRAVGNRETESLDQSISGAQVA